MQDSFVVLEFHRSQHIDLVPVRVGEQGQRVVGMAGQHRVVEALFAVAGGQQHTVGIAAQRTDRRGQAHAGPPVRGDCAHVAGRATLDDAPLGPVVRLEHAVVVHEAQQVLDRELEYGPRRRGPQGRCHRHDMVPGEHRGIAMRIEVVAERGPFALGFQRRGRLAIEAQDVPHHAQERGRHEVALLAEQRAQASGVVFEPAARVLHGKAHRGGLRSHAELVEQSREQGIVGVVEDDEAGVHRVFPPRLPDLVGMGVSPEPVFSLEHDHVVLPRQQPSRAETGDAAAHDGDLHRRVLSLSPVAHHACWRAWREGPTPVQARTGQ